MKLDKMKFGMLVAHCVTNGMSAGQYEIERLDELTEVEAPAQPIFTTTDLHTLMLLMQEGTRKIEAIKQHRMMTGYGLKESKDIVEKYWPKFGWSKDELIEKLNNRFPPNADYDAIKSFIDNL